MSKQYEYVGQIFNQWLILDVLETPGNSGHKLCRARCINCGAEKDQYASHLQTEKWGCLNCRLMPKGQVGFNLLFNSYKRSAQKRGYAFELTVEDFARLTKGNCHYCDVPPLMVKTHGKRITTWGHYTYNGIDRKENDIGYINTNCVSCCTTCNYMKRMIGYDDFTSRCERITANLNRSSFSVQEFYQ